MVFLQTQAPHGSLESDFGPLLHRILSVHLSLNDILPHTLCFYSLLLFLFAFPPLGQQLCTRKRVAVIFNVPALSPFKSKHSIVLSSKQSPQGNVLAAEVAI